MAQGYRFGDFEMSVEERRLRLQGREAAIGSRAFDVLVALVQNRDRVVGKNELMDLAWPGLVVEENNLQAQVSALRKVLGARAIATIPGRGYRFTLAGPAAGPSAEPPGAATSATEVSPAAGDELPAPLTTLIGRDDDLAALQQLLPRHRVVTLVGPGGIGKTGLALAAAHGLAERPRDGVAWVELAPVSDGALVPAALAQALRVTGASGDVQRELVAVLRSRAMLVVLDNAEHVVEAVAALVATMIANCRGLTFMVTSQAALKIPPERVYRLDALDVPEQGTPLDEAREHGAIALFAERAQAADRRFGLTPANLESVVDICGRLDGIPLAIELAAARVPLLGLEGVAKHLDERLRLLTGGSRGAPTRQQTLRAALDWSYNLLDAREQQAFRRLGVFAGGFSLPMAIAVARIEGDDDWDVVERLGRLVERSLVEADGREPPRYRLLESARSYALATLEEAHERADAQRAHAQAMLAVFEKASEDFWTDSDEEWMESYVGDIDNVRAAFDWSERHEPTLGIRLFGLTTPLFPSLSLEHEFRRRGAALEPFVTPELPPVVAARYWLARAEALHHSRAENRQPLARRAMEHFRRSEDERGLYHSICIAAQTEETDVSRSLLEEALRMERPQWPARLRLHRATSISLRHVRERRVEGIVEAREWVLALAREARSRWLLSRALANRADAALTLGDAAYAVRLWRELAAEPQLYLTSQPLFVLGNLANALLQIGEVAEARERLTAFVDLSRISEWESFDVFSDVAALLAAKEARFEAAGRLIGFADAAYGRLKDTEREPNEAHARELALAATRDALGAVALERLMAEGRRLDDVTASEIALGIAGT